MMDIRFLSAGMGQGTAQLEIGFRDRRIIYCGGVRMATPVKSPPVRVSRCDLLLLDAPVAEPKPGSPVVAARKLSDWVGRAVKRKGAAPAVVCGSFTAGFDAAWVLADAQVPVHCCRLLYDKLRRVANLGFPFGQLRRLNQSWPEEGVVLHLKKLWESNRTFDISRIDAAYAGPGRAVPDWASSAFRTGESEDRPGLVKYIGETGARVVAVGADCDDDTVVAIVRAGFSVHRVRSPIQLPLPL